MDGILKSLASIFHSSRTHLQGKTKNVHGCVIFHVAYIQYVFHVKYMKWGAGMAQW